MKTVLIIGSEGQDGMLIKRLLYRKDYQLWGLGRSKCRDYFGLTGYLLFDLEKDDYTNLINLIRDKKPDEIYYLAAFHHSSQEKEISDTLNFINKSVKINQIGFINVLEIVKENSPLTKVFYASSSLIYSGCLNPFQTENTLPEPRCIYSASKCGSMDAAKYYRNTHNIFVSVGILYNHESVLRKDYYLSKKIISESRLVKEGKIESITIGDLSALTDWGYAPDYVEAMWHILQLEIPDVYIISSGQPHSVQNWFEVLFEYLNLDWRKYVVEDPSIIIRKKPILIGDNQKLRSSGWSPAFSFKDMVLDMYENL
jgi:GDPmannose 4,6-dehydratase